MLCVVVTSQEVQLWKTCAAAFTAWKFHEQTSLVVVIPLLMLVEAIPCLDPLEDRMEVRN